MLHRNSWWVVYIKILIRAGLTWCHVAYVSSMGWNSGKRALTQAALQLCSSHWGLKLTQTKLKITLEEILHLHQIGCVGSCNSHLICLKTGNCTWYAKLYQRTRNKQAVLVDAVSQPLTPDVVFILLPVFGLQTNHSFKALMITYHQVWLHPSLLTFTMIWEILSAGKETGVLQPC